MSGTTVWTLASLSLSLSVLSPVLADDARIAAVEAGLRPDVAFVDDPLWTIEERMAHYGVPGMQIAVIDDFEIAWFKSYGVADPETDEPVRETTLFQAASVSKPVAAAGALLMVQEGRIALDSDINASLTSWSLPGNDFTDDAPVTLRHLLSHTGGLTVHGFLGYADRLDVPTTTEVLDGSGPANSAPIRVDKAPGEGYRYSGGGYTIAQLAMRDVADAPFPTLMDDILLSPLGMSQSTFLQPLPPDRLRHAAAGRLPDGRNVAGKRHVYPEMAAAGLWTTAGDIATFAIEVQNAIRGKGERFTRDTAVEMLESVDADYALGFNVHPRGGEPYFGHGGWNEGFCSTFTAHRDNGNGVVVMINSNHPGILNEVTNAVAHTYGWDGYELHERQPIGEDALASYAGRYADNVVESTTVVHQGGSLFMSGASGRSEELHHVGDGRFVRRGGGAPITFVAGDGGATLTFVDRDGDVQTRERLSEMTLTPYDRLISGQYDEALVQYREAKAADPDLRSVSEGYLNMLGYNLLNSSPDAAISVFRLNTDLYPESTNVWDSLGEGYREMGELEKSLDSYRAALERNPDYESAVQAVAELEELLK